LGGGDCESEESGKPHGWLSRHLRSNNK